MLASFEELEGLACWRSSICREPDVSLEPLRPHRGSPSTCRAPGGGARAATRLVGLRALDLALTQVAGLTALGRLTACSPLTSRARASASKGCAISPCCRRSILGDLGRRLRAARGPPRCNRSTFRHAIEGPEPLRVCPRCVRSILRKPGRKSRPLQAPHRAGDAQSLRHAGRRPGAAAGLAALHARPVGNAGAVRARPRPAVSAFARCRERSGGRAHALHPIPKIETAPLTGGSTPASGMINAAGAASRPRSRAPA